jgi:hypothetical protein
MDLLIHPAIQAGIIPFLLTLALALLLTRVTPGFSDIAPVIAFLFALIVIYGAGNESLAWIQKTIVVCILAILLGALLERVQMHPIYLGAILWLMGMAGGAWVLLPQFKEMNSSAAMLTGIMLTFYPAWLTWGVSEMRFRPIQVYSALTLLGLGTGIGAVFGRSLLVGQLALAMGFASGAIVYLIVVAKWDFPASYKITLPTGITIGLLGACALTYASFSPVSLVVLALIPLVFMVLPEDAMDSLGGFLLWIGLALGIAVVAVFLAYVGVIRGYI